MKKIDISKIDGLVEVPMKDWGSDIENQYAITLTPEEVEEVLKHRSIAFVCDRLLCNKGQKCESSWCGHTLDYHHAVNKGKPIKVIKISKHKLFEVE